VERGLAVGTARGYVDLVRPFVESRVTATGETELWDLSPADVLPFLLAETSRRSRKSAKLLVSALRSLLGFWHVHELIGRPLAGAVPSVAGWRLAGLPHALSAEHVRALLDSCDRLTVAGMRDFAILTMLVRLGMRRGEIAVLRLDARRGAPAVLPTRAPQRSPHWRWSASPVRRGWQHSRPTHRSRPDWDLSATRTG